jgi:hypothetical protein
MQLPIRVDNRENDEFCRRHQIKRLALFGSVLRADFGPESDIDILVEFEEGSTPTLFGIVRMESELSVMLERDVDLRTPEDLSHHFRDRVREEALVQCGARGGCNPIEAHA